MSARRLPRAPMTCAPDIAIREVHQARAAPGPVFGAGGTRSPPQEARHRGAAARRLARGARDELAHLGEACRRPLTRRRVRRRRGRVSLPAVAALPPAMPTPFAPSPTPTVVSRSALGDGARPSVPRRQPAPASTAEAAHALGLSWPSSASSSPRGRRPEGSRGAEGAAADRRSSRSRARSSARCAGRSRTTGTACCSGPEPRREPWRGSARKIWRRVARALGLA